MTTPPTLARLRTLLAQGRRDKAVAMLQQLDPADTAALLDDLPFEEQQNLFRKLSLDYAAPNDLRHIAGFYGTARRAGFIEYVSDINLDMIYPSQLRRHR